MARIHPSPAYKLVNPSGADPATGELLFDEGHLPDQGRCPPLDNVRRVRGQPRREERPQRVMCPTKSSKPEPLCWTFASPVRRSVSRSGSASTSSRSWLGQYTSGEELKDQTSLQPGRSWCSQISHHSDRYISSPPTNYMNGPGPWHPPVNDKTQSPTLGKRPACACRGGELQAEPFRIRHLFFFSPRMERVNPGAQ